MDMMSLYYFSELAKDLHITHTANRLFISQQTLSNHISRLEEYYGTPLLYRKPKLALTCAGELVLAFAELVNREHTNLKDCLSDIEQQEQGRIRFGASHLRVNGCLPRILPQFHARYPNVELRITDDLSSRLEQMVVDGMLDFAIVLRGEENPKLESRYLMADQVYLCVADSLLIQHYGESAEELKEAALQGAQVADFARLPFCLNSNRMGREIARCFEEAQITPVVYTVSPDAQISLSLCCRQLAACFATHTRLVDQRSSLPANLNIFPLHCDGQPLIQQLALIHRRDRYLTHYAKLFLELLFRHFTDVEQMQMGRKV